MGAWSAEPFGNDTAGDWAYEFEDAQDLDLVRTAFAEIRDEAAAPEPYIDAYTGTVAVAAAAVVAQMLGAGAEVTGRFTPALEELLDGLDEAPRAPLVNEALAALRIVRLPHSELAELWEGDEAWPRALDLLEAFLGTKA